MNNAEIGSGIYELRSLICHRGQTIRKGHYVAIEVVSGQEQVVVYDDDKIYEDSRKEIEGYILGFKKMICKW